MSAFLFDKAYNMEDLFSRLQKLFLFSNGGTSRINRQLLSDEKFYELYNNIKNKKETNIESLQLCYKMAILTLIKTKFNLVSPLVCLIKDNCKGKEGVFNIKNDELIEFSEDYSRICSLMGCILDESSISNLARFSPIHLFSFLDKQLCKIEEINIFTIYNLIKVNYDFAKNNESLFKALIVKCLSILSKSRDKKEEILNIYCEMFDSFDLNIVDFHKKYMDHINCKFPFKKGELKYLLSGKNSSLVDFIDENYIFRQNEYSSLFYIGINFQWSNYKFPRKLINDLIEHLDFLTENDIRILRENNTETIHAVTKKFNYKNLKTIARETDKEIISKNLNLEDSLYVLNFLFYNLKISLTLENEQDVKDIINSRCIHDFLQQFLKEIIHYNSSKIHITGMNRKEFFDSLSILSRDTLKILKNINKTQIIIEK